MKRLLLPLIILFFACGLKAQTDFRPGYVITLSGDTVYGQIDYRGDYTMGHVCRFESNDGLKTEYTPGSIQTYRFTDSKYFVSREVNGQKYFLEYLIQGKMDIYYLRDDNGDHYYLEKGNEPLVEIRYTKDILWVDGKEYFYQSKTHIGLLNYVTMEAPQLQKKIGKIKKPDHKSLINIAKDYHYAVCEDDEQCIIFERPVPLFKIQAEPFVGYYSGLRQEDNIKKYGFTPISFLFGANVYVWMPRTNENWYFKTGITYTNVESMHVFTLPLQFAYVFPKGKFRPTFSGGMNFRWLKYNTESIAFATRPAYSVGLLTMVDAHTSLTVNFEVETEPLSETLRFLPNYKVMLLTTSLGLRYTF
jgi:hypothetical protein